MSMAKKREEKLMKSLRDFMKTPENKKCADCQEKVIWANPLWTPHHATPATRSNAWISCVLAIFCERPTRYSFRNP